MRTQVLPIASQHTTIFTHSIVESMTKESRPNAFLLQADHRQGCWCMRCRNEAVDSMAQRFTLRQLNEIYLRTIPRRTEATLDQMFKDTRQC